MGGPRQAGKTTLLRQIFADLPYVTLEDADTQLLASADPRAFLKRYPTGAILDEVQRVPQLFNYLQAVLDEGPSFFALSGSQNYLLMDGITQSLAGRVAILTLHPLAYAELPDRHTVDFLTAVLQGGYPRLIDRQLDRYHFYDSYVATYVERDVRTLRNVADLAAFTRFVRLCAARTAQQLNYSSLANDADVSVNTAKAWLLILETSYLIFRLEPYDRNFNKRITKTPKHFFYDTGLACHLLGIETTSQLRSSYLYGQLAQTYLIAERHKTFTNRARRPQLSFWRESNQHEVDLLEASGDAWPHAYHLKGSQTFNPRFFDGLDYWRGLTNATAAQASVVYAGDQEQQTPRGALLSWRTWLDVPY